MFALVSTFVKVKNLIPYKLLSKKANDSFPVMQIVHGTVYFNASNL